MFIRTSIGKLYIIDNSKEKTKSDKERLKVSMKNFSEMFTEEVEGKVPHLPRKEAYSSMDS